MAAAGATQIYPGKPQNPHPFLKKIESLKVLYILFTKITDK